MDLVCLVADTSMAATIEGILGRPQALGIRAIQTEVIVHPRRDPGCFHEAAGLLLGYRNSAEHALVMLDRQWDGAPADTGEELEDLLEKSLEKSDLGDWAHAVVIDPELEAWVFSDSPHLASVFGWQAGMADLRRKLANQGLWREGDDKPHDPKAAAEWIRRQSRKPLSSSLPRAGRESGL